MLSSVSHRILTLIVALFLITGGLVQAASDWDGSVDNNWFEPDNWTPPGIPGASDTVTLSAGDIVLTNETLALDSFTMSGGTLVFSNWNARLEASQIAITGGEVSLPPAFVNNATTNRIHFKGDTFTLTSPGTINADGGGFRGAPINGSASGLGAGGNGTSGGGGGGHGGVGNSGYNGVAGVTNGAPIMPGPGSGGGRGGSNPNYFAGADGGGNVVIEMTGAVSLNGIISANGLDSGSGNERGGGGSGGGILITGNTINGTSGVVRANGGYGARYGGSGGGGRIAILVDAIAQKAAAEHDIQFSVGSKTGAYVWPGDIGSLYFSDAACLNGSLLTHTGELILPGSTWAFDEFHVSNSWLRVNNPSGTLSISSNVLIEGSSGKFELSGADLICGGDLSVTNNGDFYVYASATNAVPGNPDYGCLVSVSGAVNIAGGCWIYPVSHLLNGGSPLFRMASLNIASNAGFNANNSGFSRGITTTGDKNGYGPGKSESSFNSGGGAGYGGLGGRCSENATRGGIYGDTNRPIHAGSGGASKGQASGNQGGNGGGSIRLEIDGEMTLKGTLTANGQAGVIAGGGGGSGGSVFVQCRSYTAEPYAKLSVRGGNGTVNSTNFGGGGGGGRIAIWHGSRMEGEIDYERLVISSDTADFAGDVSLSGGTGYETVDDSDEGSFRLIQVLKKQGTLLFFR